MSTWRERMAARAAAAAAAPPPKRGVRFIGNATGETNVAPSPPRAASPHHRNRNVTRRLLKAKPAVTPNAEPPLKPGKGAPKFRDAVRRAATPLTRKPRAKRRHHKKHKTTKKRKVHY